MKRTRRDRLVDRVTDYVRAAGRKVRPGIDPNDRNYDPDFQRKLRRISPEQFDSLLRRDEED